MIDKLPSIDNARLRDICRRGHMRRLAVFGSLVRDAARPDSDIDLLVEFEPGREPGLLALAGIEAELSALFGRDADLRTPEDLSPRFRDDVRSQAQVVYDG